MQTFAHQQNKHIVIGKSFDFVVPVFHVKQINKTVTAHLINARLHVINLMPFK